MSPADIDLVRCLGPVSGWRAYLVAGLLAVGCQKGQDATATPDPSASTAVDAKAEFAELVCKSLELSGSKERDRRRRAQDAARWVAQNAKVKATRDPFEMLSKPGVAVDSYAEIITGIAKDIGANVRPCTLLEFLAKLPKGPVVTVEGDKVLFDYKPVDTLADAAAAKAAAKPVVLANLLAEMKSAAKRWRETHPSSETFPGVFVLEAASELDAFYVKCIMLTASTAGFDKLEPLVR